jgi:iron complex outermembrane receptor protein
MKSVFFRQVLLGTSCFAMLGGASAVTAAETGADAPQAASSVTEVIVTAQKRSQRLIDVPVGVSVMSAEAIEKRGVQTVQDLSFSVPGLILRYDGPGSTQVFMRGAANLRGSDALVSTYMDDVPVTLTGGYRQLDLRMLDIERVEVLKGPQGTLYGQGAMAGTIRFVTATPRLDTFEGNLKADYSQIDHGGDNTKLTGAVTVPLIAGKMALRLAGAVEDGGGWIDQPAANIKDGNGQDIYNFRAKLYYAPTDKFDLTATAAIYSMKSQFGVDYESKDHLRVVPFDQSIVLPPRHDRSNLLNVTGNYDFVFARLTSSTSFVRLNRDYTLDYIAGPQTPYGVQNEGYDGNRDRAKQFTQEIRLTSAASSPLQYTIGGFYKDANGNLDDVGVSYYAGATYPFTYRKYDTSESASAFADVSYKFADRLTLGAGIRTFRDKATATDGFTKQGATFKSTDPRVYLTYALTPAWNVYGNVSRGFRSGGFNASSLPAYDPEKLTNYEVGTKGAVAQGRVHFDFAAFFSKYEDALRTGQFFDFANSGGFISFTRNIGEMEVKGLEGSVDWMATPQLRISTTAAYTHSEITKLDIAAGESTNVKVGDRGDYSPKWSASVAADYNFAWSASVNGFLHADYSYRDKIYTTDDSIFLPQFRVQSSQSIGLLSARVGAEWSQVTAALYVNNLTNENRLVDPFDGFAQSARTKPRTIGVSLAKSF